MITQRLLYTSGTTDLLVHAGQLCVCRGVPAVLNQATDNCYVPWPACVEPHGLPMVRVYLMPSQVLPGHVHHPGNVWPSSFPEMCLKFSKIQWTSRSPASSCIHFSDLLCTPSRHPALQVAAKLTQPSSTLFWTNIPWGEDSSCWASFTLVALQVGILGKLQVKHWLVLRMTVKAPGFCCSSSCDCQAALGVWAVIFQG